MILNYKGKMIDKVNRMKGDLQTTEDGIQTTEDDRGMMEDDQDFHLLTYRASRNPFECYEMILNYKGKMRRLMEGDLQTTEDDLHPINLTYHLLFIVPISDYSMFY